MKKQQALTMLALLFTVFLVYAQFLPPDQSFQPSGATEKAIGMGCLIAPQGYKHAKGWPVNYHYNQEKGQGVDCTIYVSEDYPLAALLDIGLIAVAVMVDAVLIKNVFLHRRMAAKPKTPAKLS